MLIKFDPRKGVGAHEGKGGLEYCEPTQPKAESALQPPAEPKKKQQFMRIPFKINHINYPADTDSDNT